MGARSKSRRTSWEYRRSNSGSQVPPAVDKGRPYYKLYRGLVLMQLSEAGVGVDGHYSIDATLSRAEFYAYVAKRDPAHAPRSDYSLLREMSACEDWRYLARTRRFVELDRLLHHHSWRGEALPE